jgi:hypothetical protein
MDGASREECENRAVDDSTLRPLSPITRAALALHHRPGGCVALLGAGISKPTGVGTAWDVLDALIRKVATTEGASPDDPFEWWMQRTGTEANYGGVLEELASTPSDRRALLAPFFEGADRGAHSDRPVPSQGHCELARLARTGHIRIILTLNFDHLMEQALRDVGIEPVIVSGAASIEAMEPLHSQRCLVAHLHGEYTSPELLNTMSELAEYTPAVDHLVAQVAHEYGLLIVGWSASWDTRLVELLKPQGEPPFATWWVEPGDPNPTQQRLALARRAEFITLDADSALTSIGAAVEAIEVEATRAQPVDTARGVAVMKRELRTGGLGIDSHDLIRRALGDLL